MPCGRAAPTVGDAVQVEELLRRLALNDDEAVRAAIAGGPASAALDLKTAALVRLAALLSIGAVTASCRAAVGLATAAGATEEEVVGVLVAIAPAVGAARLVTAAPRLALAIDYDVEAADEAWNGP
jgi:alkylhydroperoxidase/carboxymuconolactone decarboxylase family protein YurZ